MNGWWRVATDQFDNFAPQLTTSGYGKNISKSFFAGYFSDQTYFCIMYAIPSEISNGYSVRNHQENSDRGSVLQQLAR